MGRQERRRTRPVVILLFLEEETAMVQSALYVLFMPESNFIIATNLALFLSFVRATGFVTP
jgi:hypothetical protein